MTNHAANTTLIDHTTTSNLANTASVLAAARNDIHNAVAAADDPHRRHQHALAARDNAVAVLLANDATPDETRHAEYYLADAEAFIAAAN
ncbi:hypothetical protein [Mycolicibacterium mageritense]|uniref:hypothetical protein n=1 Tax=Mycolicibacterium mageritense TaxID=53462 RepID=UPI0011D9111E|nr:hypothetical protein [Mycolicibacterium mageritense]TXI58917.1 MAG: hypothetical protein E6Q55_22555 [Mycolicibacterium mageritense]